jgi:hypothetical protein
MKSRVKGANYPSDKWPSSQATVFLIFFCLLGIFSVPSLGAADKLSICSPDRSDCERPQVIPGSDLKLNKSYLKGYIGDTGRILTSPVRWDDRDWSAAAIVLSVTAGLYAHDQDLKDWAQRRRNRTTDDLANVFTRLEWCLLIIAILIVWIAEGMNTALEAIADAVHPDHHPLIGRAKDVAAAAVLIAAVGSVFIGIHIFGNHVKTWF